MFDHPYFDKYGFDEIPLDRDLYLMDEIWTNQYEQSLLRVFEGQESGNESVGYISYAAARLRRGSDIDLSWYPNIFDRFHEVLISLPQNQFVACVGCWRYDEKPHIFVKSRWLEHLHLQSYSVFVLVDAIDVKQALKSGSITREKLIHLRDRIDALAKDYPDISFISFADSLLLKSNWHVGMYNSQIKYSYAPEIFIRLISKIQSVYREVLGLDIYAVLTQGSNAYYQDALLHISDSKNHISLNSLGLPFSQLKSIEATARTAINNNVHSPAELYMDQNFFRSLRFVFGFQKSSCGKNVYREPMMGGESAYYFASCQTILDNLHDEEL